MIAVTALAATSAGLISCNDDNDTTEVQQPGTAQPTPTTPPLPTAIPIPNPVPTMTGQPDRAVPVGEYGGTGALISVKADRVEMTFECAKGWIEAPLMSDAVGTFDTGGFYQIQIGPVPEGGYPTLQARYFGLHQGANLHLEAAYFTAEGEFVQKAYDVTAGQEPVFDTMCALDQSPQPSPMPQPSPSPQ